MEDKLKYVQVQLQRRADERQLPKVVKNTGVSRRTIGYILIGRDARREVENKLYEYLKKNVRRKIL